MSSPLPHPGSSHPPANADDGSIWQQRYKEQLAQFTENRARFMKERAKFVEQQHKFLEQQHEIVNLSGKIEELEVELSVRDDTNFSERQHVAKLLKENSELRSSISAGREFPPSPSQSSKELNEGRLADGDLQILLRGLQQGDKDMLKPYANDLLRTENLALTKDNEQQKQSENELTSKLTEQTSENLRLTQELEDLKLLLKAGGDTMNAILLAKELSVKRFQTTIQDFTLELKSAFPRSSQDVEEGWEARFNELIKEREQQQQGQGHVELEEIATLSTLLESSRMGHDLDVELSSQQLPEHEQPEDPVEPKMKQKSPNSGQAKPTAQLKSAASSSNAAPERSSRLNEQALDPNDTEGWSKAPKQKIEHINPTKGSGKGLATTSGRFGQLATKEEGSPPASKQQKKVGFSEDDFPPMASDKGKQKTVSIASVEPEYSQALRTPKPAPTADATQEKGKQKEEPVKASPAPKSPHPLRTPKPVVHRDILAKYSHKKTPEPPKPAQPSQAPPPKITFHKPEPRKATQPEQPSTPPTTSQKPAPRVKLPPTVKQEPED